MVLKYEANRIDSFREAASDRQTDRQMKALRERHFRKLIVYVTRHDVNDDVMMQVAIVVSIMI